jgi:RNA polymerase sigma-70 factor (ECF subfamily)
MGNEGKHRDGDVAARRGRWMERAQDGDTEAYRSLLEDVLPDLRSFLRRRIRDAQEAEDLLQEILLSVHRALHTYDPRRPFGAWLFAIARNTTVDSFRRQRVHRRWESLVDDESQLEGAAEAGEVSLESALASLPDSQREAVEMVKIQGLTMEEAAARSGVSEGTLRVRIHRGYRRLRERLLGGDD